MKCRSKVFAGLEEPGGEAGRGTRSNRTRSSRCSGATALRRRSGRPRPATTSRLTTVSDRGGAPRRRCRRSGCPARRLRRAGRGRGHDARPARDPPDRTRGAERPSPNPEPTATAEQIRQRLEQAEAAQQLGNPDQERRSEGRARQPGGRSARLGQQPPAHPRGSQPGEADKHSQLGDPQQIAPGARASSGAAGGAVICSSSAIRRSLARAK